SPQMVCGIDLILNLRSDYRHHGRGAEALTAVEPAETTPFYRLTALVGRSSDGSFTHATSEVTTRVLARWDQRLSLAEVDAELDARHAFLEALVQGPAAASSGETVRTRLANFAS
ncbi:MAG: hypothetical protein O3B84_07660, partial [Chloroflexi bacterium]|nr:hypothetical protein [Chloroflexota bacterium]